MSDRSKASNFHRITGEVVSIPPHFPAPVTWAILFGISMCGVGLLILSVIMVFTRGV